MTRTITHTYTRTWPLLDAWASTLPWNCHTNPAGCVAAGHDHAPVVGDPCAVPECGRPLRGREVCYAAVEYPARTGPPPGNPAGPHRQREQWVCWRHIRPADGPIVLP